ncbi:MAG: stage V sporulation protein AB [Clostridia bacterium]|nr:stage V sporulation protein AB [Clostridia bacterium]
MTAVLLGLMGGLTVGVCAAPLWMMLQLPMRLTDILNVKANMRLCAAALAVGAALGAVHAAGFLPVFLGIAAMVLGGMFVGMLGSALAEAVEVVPVFFDRLSITADMRYAAAALTLGKTAGVIVYGLMNG